MDEYRLHQPGNQYEWDGVASGTVSVIELDSDLPDDYGVLARSSQFPDKTGMGPSEIPLNVMTELAVRLVNRTTWLMYDHQEKYYLDY